MVHWVFLIVAFVAGFAACYGLLYELSKVYSQVIEAIEEGSKAR